MSEVYEQFKSGRTQIPVSVIDSSGSFHMLKPGIPSASFNHPASMSIAILASSSFAIEADPERKQREMAKKAERRRQRRAAKLSDKVSLTQREKLLNFEQSLITRQLNDKIKANPNIILKNEKLLDKLSTTVDSEGNIIKSKPTIYELEKRGIFEIEHQRDVRKAGAMKDFPYNRNPILGPHNRAGGFKDMAEKFIEKNPNPKKSKVKNIIKKAEELKITLQPNVP